METCPVSSALSFHWINESRTRRRQSSVIFAMFWPEGSLAFFCRYHITARTIDQQTTMVDDKRKWIFHWIDYKTLKLSNGWCSLIFKLNLHYLAADGVIFQISVFLFFLIFFLFLAEYLTLLFVFLICLFFHSKFKLFLSKLTHLPPITDPELLFSKNLLVHHPYSHFPE